MMLSRSKRRTWKLSANWRMTSSTASLPWRAPRNGNMSIGPYSAHSTSSSIRASMSSKCRSLIARCNAREKRQRLCSVILGSPEAGLRKNEKQPQAHRIGAAGSLNSFVYEQNTRIRPKRNSRFRNAQLISTCEIYNRTPYFPGSGRFWRELAPVRPLAHDQRADLTFQHLLHQIVGIDDLADLHHLAAAESVEHGHVDLNDAVVAALPEEHAQIGRDRVALGDDLRHLVADLGVSLAPARCARIRRAPACRGRGPCAAARRSARG